MFSHDLSFNRCRGVRITKARSPLRNACFKMCLAMLCFFRNVLACVFQLLSSGLLGYTEPDDPGMYGEMWCTHWPDVSPTVLLILNHHPGWVNVKSRKGI